MPPSKLPILIALLCLLQSYLYAQEKSKEIAKLRFGKISPSDFDLPVSGIIDSNTNAAILSDAGTTHFVGNRQGWFSYVFKKQTRIKIINKKSLELATVRINLYTTGDDPEKVDKVSASTYNLENGKIVETKLDKNEIFEERQDKHHIEKKFTMPSVKEGSIIEYTYTITSDYYFNLPSWEFQSIDYPCLWSECEIVVPQMLSYLFVKQGIHSFCIDKGAEGREAYTVTDKSRPNYSSIDQDLIVNTNTVTHHWAMKDIPAFHVENYLTTPQNYIDKIGFQLSKTYNGEDTHDVMNSWKKATEDLLKREDFGEALGDTYWLNELLHSITSDSANALQRAKDIYYYVASHFTCTDHYSPYIKTTLSDFIKKRSGTVGDINLLLVALLRQGGIYADPVLLSTRDHGFNFVNYPVMDRLNYVISRTKINDRIYYLDASRPKLGFGQLPGNCYNGHARIISEKDSGSVFFYADSVKEQKTTMVIIANSGKGPIGGSFQSLLGTQESYNMREMIAGIGEENYFKNIQTSYGEDLDITQPGIDSLEKPEKPVKVYYDFTLKQAPGSSLIYFNPMFADAIRENPFKAAERKYPVERPYTFDNSYIFTMELPEGYAVEELPKSTKVSFNGDEGFFQYLVGHQGSFIQLNCRLRLSRASFSADEYADLRDFFAFVVKKESEMFVLKKL